MTVVAALLDPYLTDWLNLLIRWLHVIAAIAWIGASFYFVLLDQSLEAPTKVEDLRDGVGGELWEVHGGGFYHVKKYKVAPPVLPEPPRLVQVGGVHDVALGLRADGRPLLPQRAGVPDRPRGGRPDAVAGRRDQRRAARRRVDRLRRPLPAARRATASCSGC